MAWRKSRGSRDGASVHVLEAVLLGIILLGAAYSVVVMREPGGHASRPRVNLQALAEDALVILAGLNDTRGNLLESYLAEGIHCAQAPHPSETDCDGPRSENLSLKLQSYLPAGVGYMYAVSNGVDERVLYRSTLPEGETVTASRTLSPNWNATFMVPELSCYEASMAVNVTMLPLWRGQLAQPLKANATVASLNATATRDSLGHWNLTFPAATRPASGVVAANVTGAATRNGTFPGATSYASCDLAGAGALVVDALRASEFGLEDDVVPVGEEARFEWSYGPLAAVPGVSVVSANVTVYEPLAPFGPGAGAYVPAAVVDLPADASGEATWSVPSASLYGVHPVVLTVRLQAGSVQVDAHRVATLSVALPSGEVPIDPPYRAVLQVWFPDWR